MNNLTEEINHFCEFLITKYGKMKQIEEVKLVEEIRKQVPPLFFFQFLQYFVNQLEKKGLSLNSKFILKNLIQNYEMINEKDFLAYGDGESEDTLKVDEEKEIQLGTIGKLISNLDLKETKKYILTKSRKIEIPELELDLIQQLDKEKLVELIYQDFEGINDSIITRD